MRQFLQTYLTERVKALLIMAPAAVSVAVPTVLRIVRLFVNA